MPHKAYLNEKHPCIAVIGTGRMGPGIALSFAGGGCPVLLVGRGKPQLKRAQTVIQEALALMVNNGLMEGAAAEATTARLRMSTDLTGISKAEIVVEATPEVLAHKQKLLAELEAIARSNAILATNTSGLPITQIAVGMRFPQRLVGMKFVIPAHLIPLVEVVKGQSTDIEVMESVCTVLRQIGKRPVKVMHDVPGFLQNRVQQAMRREAINLVARGIASAEDVDAAVQWGFGFRLLGAGTLESMDLVGLEQILRIHSYILPDLDPPSDPSPLLRQLIAGGKTGAGAGQGFLSWDAAREKVATRRMETVMVELLKLLQRIEETSAVKRDKTK